MPALIDKTGQTFGRLTVLARENKVWKCMCSCGSTTYVEGYLLSSGKTRSCGCFRRERGRAHGAHINLRHGRNGTPEYLVWDAMKQRCLNPDHAQWDDYGGRGITVCDRWRKFELFFADMGERPSKAYSLDRIDNNGPYSPENCRWATRGEQNSNKRGNRRITIGDRSEVLAVWLRELGIPQATFYNRVNRGMTDEQALTAARPKRPPAV